MKCCVSTAVGTGTNWLTFEPGPDYSPDAGTGLLSPLSYNRWYAEFYVGKIRRKKLIRIGRCSDAWFYNGFIHWASEPSKHLCRRYVRSTECPSCFYCRIQPEGLLYDTEHDLLALAKFLVTGLLDGETCGLRANKYIAACTFLSAWGPSVRRRLCAWTRESVAHWRSNSNASLIVCTRAWCPSLSLDVQMSESATASTISSLSFLPSRCLQLFLVLLLQLLYTKSSIRVGRIYGFGFAYTHHIWSHCDFHIMWTLN